MTEHIYDLISLFCIIYKFLSAIHFAFELSITYSLQLSAAMAVCTDMLDKPYVTGVTYSVVFIQCRTTLYVFNLLVTFHY